MVINEIFENENLNTLLDESIRKTYAKFKLHIIIEKEDFEQEVYLFIIDRIKMFDDSKSSIRTYLPLLIMSCARRCIQTANGQSKNYNKLEFENSHLRLNDCYSNNLESDDKEFGTFVSSDYNLEEETINKITLEQILTMDNLSEKQIEIIKLKLSGLTEDSIANIMGCSQSGIQKSFKRARQKIVMELGI
jgi:RNA polymerase sigma factor (sigma-70 family)